MFHKQHAVDLYESAEKALARAEVMAQHRHRERKSALTALRREQFLGDQTAAQNANDAAAAKRGADTAVDGACVLPEDAAASLNKARASKLRAELAKLEAVSDRMLSRLAIVDVDAAAAEQLLPHLPQTLAKVRAAVPAIASELPRRLDDLFLALAFASVVHDGGSVDGIGALDAVLTQEEVQSLRLRALHTFATRSDVGDMIGDAHPTVVRLALSTPSYRAALADRITNVRKAWEERQRSPAGDAGSAALPRMQGSIVAIAKALLPTDPASVVDFIEGSVVPGLLPHLDHTTGSIFPTPGAMHRHLYEATLRGEFAEVVRLAERQGGEAAKAAMELEASLDAARRAAKANSTPAANIAALETELDAKVHHAAACGDVADLTRTLLYRVLLSVEQLVQRRRNLATAEDSQAPGSVATGVTSRRRAVGDGANERSAVMVNVAQATSSVGAAQSHRSLSALIEQAADQQGLSVTATTRHSLAGHEILDVETAAGVPVVAFYVHRGAVFAARYSRPSRAGQRVAAPAPNSFTELQGGAVELIAVGAAAARKL